MRLEVFFFFIKTHCFHCLWNSRYQHLTRESTGLQGMALQWNYTISNFSHWRILKKILFPPVHIKLGLMIYIFFFFSSWEGVCYFHIFTRPETKIKGGIFIQPQLRKIRKCSKFLLKVTEKKCQCFITMGQDFLGNNKGELHGTGWNFNEKLWWSELQDVFEGPYPRCSSRQLQGEYGSIFRGTREALPPRYNKL